MRSAEKLYQPVSDFRIETFVTPTLYILVNTTVTIRNGGSFVILHP